ncbi:MAG: IS21-like element helper ATPase IstB [Candidatus Krumholzibacteria bacterium]|nr:IS21-like element helper ATPase IstB [Candidatus Krumholzibacteria bacterium]
MVAIDPQLIPRLKSLRLSGILETLEVRNQQAIDDKLSYVEFLERLLEDEVERRAQKQLQMRLRRASFSTDKTLEKFDWSFNPSIDRQQVLDLATCRWIDRKEVVLVVGPSGVGKSHIAQALGHEACRRGRNVLFTSVSKMLAHINGGRADGTAERRLAGYLRPELLILDDFGLKSLRGIEQEDLYEVINERYERSSLLLTSNRDYQEWPDVFADNPLLASAALDRLAHRAHLITITGASFRAQQKPKQMKDRE